VNITEAFEALEQSVAKAIDDMNGTAAIPVDLARAILDMRRPRPRAEWHEDMGPVLWWKFPVDEAPYVGGENDDEFLDYATHFTPMVPLPKEPSHG